MSVPAKSALVTGTARGLGRAIAFQLAGEGFKVALNDLNLEELEKVRDILAVKGHEVIIVGGDVSVDEDVQRIVAQTVGEFGRLDVMIANAGVLLSKPLIEITPVEIDNIFAVNTRGVFLCYKYAAKQMIAQGHGGKLIGIGSIAGHRGYPLVSAYCASKFAVRGLTESAALELGKHGISVNCVSPGDMDTPLARKICEQFGGFEAIFAGEVKMTPLGRMGTVEDVAKVVSFLSTDQASWINGQTIIVDGGRSLNGTVIPEGN